MRSFTVLKVLYRATGSFWYGQGISTDSPYKNTDGAEQYELLETGEEDKLTTPPVPNLELANFLKTLKIEKMTEHENPAYREDDDNSMSCDEDNCRRIRECKIGVMGASGVGKTSLVPIVLVGSKSDLYRKRRVTAYEGQTLARHIGCPFLEISARNNDCVNEAFLELMRIVERRRLRAIL
ncbi:Ras family protein [Oesophagostomum dentatum]|uniref:small monomeric GTPase n=1 Tax=Oesophagostomum dentatum TaxID=61180 RepID=A0A0B1SK48_OESDE|nr:Ras family protein [Oesophagostomum dentatum]